jgi:hypothetical protein
METLGKILGNTARVKIMRLFLLNKTLVLSTKEIASRSRVNLALSRKELKLLYNVNFLKKKGLDWTFDPNFKYIREFEGLLLGTDILDKEYVWELFKKVGKVKLLIVAGIFIKDKNSRLDLFIVGDNLNNSKIKDCVKKIEAEIGQEIRYTPLESKDFAYRINMYDKLVRDILDYPHEVIYQAKDLKLST